MMDHLNELISNRFCFEECEGLYRTIFYEINFSFFYILIVCFLNDRKFFEYCRFQNRIECESNVFDCSSGKTKRMF